MKGTVKWYNSMKGFGFIRGEDGKDVFVHSSVLPPGIAIDEEAPVEFDVEEAERGLRATKVTMC
jgi:CspA family cold shock protein